MNKFTTSMAVAAIAIATTGVAEARIALGGDQLPTGAEFALAITNLTKQTSYVLDTGIFVTAPNYANPLSITGSVGGTDSALTSFLSNFAAGDEVIWGFGSSYKKFQEEADAPLVGYYGTKENATPLPSGAQGWDQAGSAWDNIAGENQFDNTNNAINGSVYKTVGQPGYLGPFGKNGFGTAAYNIFGDLANALVFVDEGIIFDPNTGDTTRDFKVLGSARLNLTANGFSFQYAPTVTNPVPLPAAVWMFGAGLMGVLRLNRRKAVAA